MIFTAMSNDRAAYKNENLSLNRHSMYTVKKSISSACRYTNGLEGLLLVDAWNLIDFKQQENSSHNYLTKQTELLKYTRVRKDVWRHVWNRFS